MVTFCCWSIQVIWSNTFSFCQCSRPLIRGKLAFTKQGARTHSHIIVKKRDGVYSQLFLWLFTWRGTNDCSLCGKLNITWELKCFWQQQKWFGCRCADKRWKAASAQFLWLYIRLLLMCESHQAYRDASDCLFQSAICDAGWSIVATSSHNLQIGAFFSFNLSCFRFFCTKGIFLKQCDWFCCTQVFAWFLCP